VSYRRVPLALIRAFAVIALVAASVTPVAAASKPQVTLFFPVTGAGISVGTLVNRATNQLTSCSYVLDNGAPQSCGTKTADGPKATRYTSSPFNPAVGLHTVVVTVRLTDNGVATGSESFTVAAPRVLAVAWSDTNSNHTYEAGVDVLIVSLVDSNRDGVPDAGDTVVADRYPVDCAPSGFGNFGVKSVAVTSAGTVDGRLVAVAGGSSFEWATVGSATNGVGIERIQWIPVGGGFNHFFQDDTTTEIPTDALFNPTENNVLVPDVPLAIVNCFDASNNSFLDVQLDS